MAEDTHSGEFYGDIIVIKVEDRLFHVPRSEFVQSSEIFSDMFHLPSGPGGNSEGQDREHPIVLEGYKKDEFSCLLKVMYPTAGSLISGTTLKLRLGKEEWVSVLKLSTMWNMEKIRTYAIHRLSKDFVLFPLEKIHLARAHKVAAWLDEGVTALICDDPKPTLDDLVSLGWETAARILGIKDKANILSNTIHFRRDSIKCAYCPTSTSLLSSSSLVRCREPNCRWIVPEDGELTVSGPATVSGPDRIILFSAMRCTCGGKIVSPGVSACRYCSNDIVGDTRCVRITPIEQMVLQEIKEMIKEMFGEEIKDYEVA